MPKNCKQEKELMDYDSVLKFMFESLPMYQRSGKAAYKANLNNSLSLDRHFDKPHKSFQSIHIAGTNGKGSVSHIIASVLQQAGYKTGLYTSPHLVDYRERIKVNGIKISKDFICKFINENSNFINSLSPSFFEMSVALAFEYFKSEHVEVAIIETGMGGRLDSTNIISPILSVITNIGIDHTDFLGKSLSEIAAEKAGIIKTLTPVVIGETHSETKDVFIGTAIKNNSEIFFADKEIDVYSTLESEIHAKSQVSEYSFYPDLKGLYQTKNYATALCVLEKLMPKLKKTDKKAIISGLENTVSLTGLRGRWEIIKDQPLVITDTAHNQAGLSLVIEQILMQDFSKLYLILGFVNDKDVESLLKLFPQNAEFYFTRADIPRSMLPKQLIAIASRVGINGKGFNSVQEAYKTAIANAGPKDMIFVGGSTFVAGDLIAYQTENLQK